MEHTTGSIFAGILLHAAAGIGNLFLNLFFERVKIRSPIAKPSTADPILLIIPEHAIPSVSRGTMSSAVATS